MQSSRALLITSTSLILLIAPAFVPLAEARSWLVSHACDVGPSDPCGAVDPVCTTVGRGICATEVCNASPAACATADSVIGQGGVGDLPDPAAAVCPFLSSVTLACTLLKGVESGDPVGTACHEVLTSAGCRVANATLADPEGTACSLGASTVSCEQINATKNDPTGNLPDAEGIACHAANGAPSPCRIFNGTIAGDPIGAACQESGVQAGCTTVNRTLGGGAPDPVGTACSNAQPSCEQVNETAGDPVASACAAVSAPPSPCRLVDAVGTGDVMNSLCWEFALGDECEAVNSTTGGGLPDPVALVCASAQPQCDDVNAIAAHPEDSRDVACNRASDQCQEVNDTAADPVGSVVAAACPIVQSDACALTRSVIEGQPVNGTCSVRSDAPCSVANATLADPYGSGCSVASSQVACALANDTKHDPLASVLSAAGTACVTAGSATCAAANSTGGDAVNTLFAQCVSACDEVNSTVRSSGIANLSSSLTINYPKAGSWNSTPLLLNFSTAFSSVGSSLYVVQVAAAGQSSWQTLGIVDCVSDGAGSCLASIPHALTGDYALRLAPANQNACNINACAWVNGVVHLDTTPPVSMIGTVPATVFTNQVTVPFTLDDADQDAAFPDTVVLHYSKDGGPDQTYDGLPSDGAFTFDTTGDGTYALWTVATDPAGNVEDVASKSPTHVVVTHSLTVIVPDVFVTDGQHAVVTALVTSNGTPVSSDAVVAVRYASNTFVMHRAGSTWQYDLGAFSIAAIQNETVSVTAGLDDASGTHDGILVESPHRLIYVSSVAPDFVEWSSDYHVSILASYADTGAPVGRLHVVASNSAGDTLAEGLTWSTGALVLTIPSLHANGTVAVTVSATEIATVPSTPVSLASRSFDAVWTALDTRLSLMDHATGWADSDKPFNLTYCAQYAHDGSPAANTFIAVMDDSSDIIWDGLADGSGCVPIAVQESDGEYNFSADATISNDIGDVVYEHVPVPQDVVFTKVALNVTTDIPAGKYLNVGDSPAFGMCAAYTFRANEPAAGAVVGLTDDNGAVLGDNVTLGDDGCAAVTRVFSGIYNGSVGLVLDATPELVTSAVGPTPIDGVVATEVVVGQISSTAAMVDWNTTVTYTVPLTWAHDGTALTQADVTMDGHSCSSVVAGAVTCDVTRSMDTRARFAPTLTTDKGVSRVQDAANVATPETIWTAVIGSVMASDDVLAVGDTTVIYDYANYSEDGSPVVGFGVHFTDACGLDSTVQGTNGLATIVLTSSVPCQSPVSSALVSTDTGITTQTDPALASENIVWTNITVAPETNDTVATLGQAILVSGTATYALTGANVPSGDLIVTSDAGDVLGEIQIVDGAFAGAIAESLDASGHYRDYNGALHFAIAQEPNGVDVVDPVTLPAAWTHVDLTESQSRSIAGAGAPISLSGTATYAAGLGRVTSGLIEILDDQASIVATATITNGTWSVDVAMPNDYHGQLVVHLAASDEQVAGIDVTTPVLTWTDIALTLAAPDDLFVNVTDTLRFGVQASYTYDGSVAVADAELAAFGADDSPLGTCHVVSGACDLDLVSSRSYAGPVHVVVMSEANGVLSQAAVASTAPIVWTRLIVHVSAPVAPANVGSAQPVTATITYEHNGEPVPDALVTISGTSVGDQYGYTNATGVVTIPAYETHAGTDNVTVVASDMGRGITSLAAPGTVHLRWTAIGFQPFTYSGATPTSIDANGNPTFHVGAHVTVCAVSTASDDTSEVLAGASVLLRGASRTTDANGSACITIVGPSSPGSVKVTAHGLNATIEGAAITASVDRTVVISFVS